MSATVGDVTREMDVQATRWLRYWQTWEDHVKAGGDQNCVCTPEKPDSLCEIVNFCQWQAAQARAKMHLCDVLIFNTLGYGIGETYLRIKKSKT